MNDIIIQAQNLHFAYEDGTKALHGIDLSIRKGRKIAFMGPTAPESPPFFSV